jgi:hypothetical protein
LLFIVVKRFLFVGPRLISHQLLIAVVIVIYHVLMSSSLKELMSSSRQAVVATSIVENVFFAGRKPVCNYSRSCGGWVHTLMVDPRRIFR